VYAHVVSSHLVERCLLVAVQVNTALETVALVRPHECYKMISAAEGFALADISCTGISMPLLFNLSEGFALGFGSY